MNNIQKFSVSLSMLAMVFIASISEAQFTLRSSVVANGGVTAATAGTLRLGATVGQAVIGRTSNGTTVLEQGFWFPVLQIVDVKEITDAPIPTGLVLEQNVPNPFVSSTKIRFGVPSGVSGKATLVVYNSLGKVVETLVNEEKSEGVYEATFNSTSLTSGVYIYELRVGAYSVSKKMVVGK